MMLNTSPRSGKTTGLHGILLLFAGLMVTLAGCSTTEIQVVDRPAITTAAPSDVSQTPTTAARLKIRVGETEPIRSLDPLFAQTESAKRLNGLIYEGLVHYDAHGAITPLLASGWTLSEDSLRYTFTLNRNASFQDSPRFIDGKGRRVVAHDVKATFTRMTSRDVPPHAAQTFADIVQGMDAFNKERRELFFQEQRSLSEIRGIIAENDSTVIFTLTRPNPGFLDALASPHGFITPREFSEPHHQQPVGSGPYKLDRMQSDTLFVLELDQSYWNHSDVISRPAIVEIRWFRSESAILSAFRRNEIDIIPDIAPVTRLSLIDSKGELNPEILPEANFVYTSGSDLIELRYNNGYQHASTTNPDALLQPISMDSLAAVTARAGIAVIPSDGFTDPEPEVRLIPDQTMRTLSFFENSYEGYLARILFQSLEDRYPLALVKTGVRSREITWYTVYVPAWQRTNSGISQKNDPVLASFSPQRMAAVHQKIAGIQFNNHPWWLRLDGIHLDQSTPMR
jgi:ABC-type transport system substrate-binding protein